MEGREVLRKGRGRAGREGEGVELGKVGCPFCLSCYAAARQCPEVLDEIEKRVVGSRMLLGACYAVCGVQSGGGVYYAGGVPIAVLK
eukprot:3662126-Rhodomonas_salina.1